jgi:hypothetical protein
MIPKYDKKKYTIKVVGNAQNIRYNAYYKYKCDINKFSNLWGSIGIQDQVLTFETVQVLMTAEKRH